MTPDTRSTVYTVGGIAGGLSALGSAIVALAAVYGIVSAEQSVAWVALVDAAVLAGLAAANVLARRHVPDAPDSHE